MNMIFGSIYMIDIDVFTCGVEFEMIIKFKFEIWSD